MRLGVCLSLSRPPAVSGAGQSAEAEALFARMATAGDEPDDTRKGHINTLIAALKSAGSWAKMDLLYVYAAHAQSVAPLNWLADTFPMTEVNSPTFTVDRGYTGDGATSELTSTFAPATHGVNLQRDSAHIGAFVLDDGGSTGYDFGATTGTLLGVRARAGTNGAVRVTSSSTVAGSSGGSAPLHIMGIRRVSTTTLNFRNGAQVNSSATASSALATNTIGSLRAISLYSVRQNAICHIGGALSDGEALATYNAFLAYLQAVGAVA